MHLNELAEHVKEHAMRRYAVKHGFALPLALGASAVAATQHGLGTYEKVREQLDQATHQQQLAPDVARKKLASQMGLPGIPQGAGFASQNARQGFGSGIGSLAGAAAGFASQNARQGFGSGIGSLTGAPLLLGTAAIGSFGKGLGDLGIQLLQDIAAKAVAAVGSHGQNAARQAILQQLKQEDAVLSNADDKVLMEAYHTMSRFAPVLSTDKNAVRSFLRQAVMSGNGADYSTIKHLADSERAVTDTGQSRR